MTGSSPLTNAELRAHLKSAAASLTREFTGIYSPETITQFVMEFDERLGACARRSSRSCRCWRIGSLASACARWPRLKERS